METEREKAKCWINENDRVISFSYADGFTCKDFRSQQNMLTYVVDLIEKQNYRVQ